MTDTSLFILCGHRGNVVEAPENTISSFLSAESVKADEIELDVKVTLDGVLVILHDRTFERTAASSSPYLHTPIEKLTFEQARSVDLGFGQRIPTFEETLDATSVLLQVEIKAPDAARPLARFLRSRPIGDQKRCLITSFEPLSLWDYTDEWSETPRGTALHVPKVDTNWRDDMRRLGVSTILTPLATLQRELVDELHDAGYRVGASLIEGPGDVRRIIDLDVDTSASDYPAYARKLLLSNAQFGQRYPSFAAGKASLAASKA